MNRNRGQFGRQFVEYLLIFLLLGGLILTALWPWVLHFRTGFPDHFDPPFHAWKLQVDADKLLQDHRLVPDTQTNVYYPYANEFYFDALLWPQGMLAALLKLAGCGPVLTYNLVFLFFWALSGLFMYLLLRELNLRRLPSLFGAAAMCLIPYRISYYVEFNMQMCFGLPLFLFFWVRYARCPGAGNAVGLGLAFWLQAVSELYQAVILALSFPLIALPYLGDIFRKHGRSLRLYLSVAAGLATVIPLCLLYLAPYFSLFHGGYGRSAREMMAHSLEPLAYLGRELVRLVFPAGFSGDVKMDEMSVFPSLTLLVLVLGYSLYARRIACMSSEWGESGMVVILRWLRFAALACFAALLLYLCRGNHAYAQWLLYLGGNSTLIMALLATILLAVLAVPGESAGRLCRGLAAAALLCFILSLGPSLLVFSRHVAADNLVFSLVSSFFPLNGFRVMSRFSVMVMIFLVVAGACFLDLLSDRKQPLQWLALPLVVSLLLEAHAMPHPFRRFALPIAPATLEAVRNQADTTVTVVPLGDRYLDGRYMLAIGGTRTLLVNGFGGFAPVLQLKIGRSLRLKPLWALSLIGSIWPRSQVLVDRQALGLLNRTGYATSEQEIRARGRLITEDPAFALYSLVEPEEPLDEYRRFVRGDILRANPVFTFEARAINGKGKDRDLFVLLNGTVIGAVRPGPDWQQYEIRLPEEGITGINYEMIFLRAINKGTWTARNGTFRPASSVQPAAVPEYESLAEKVWRNGSPRWMHYVTALPSGTLPLDVEFDNGVHLVGIDLPGRQVFPGGTTAFRTFWTIPPSLGRVALFAQVNFQGPGGSGFSCPHALASHMPVTFIISQPVQKIFVEQHSITVPVTAGQGEYVLQVHLVDTATGQQIGTRTSKSGPTAMNGWPKVRIKAAQLSSDCN